MYNKKGDHLGVDDRYQLLETLGEGTYGVVWLAQDTQLEKKAAIKILHPGMGGLHDLRKEAVTQARLDHPNIAIIYSVDLQQGFIAMEYLEGESVEQHLKNCIKKGLWIEIKDAVNIISQCFDALIYAHEHNVVHGDIKPGNIMIGQSGRIKITDFGVAKIMSEEQSSGYERYAHKRLGSTTYMAPEIMKGEPRNFKSDIFSLGVVAYLLFTGCHPFYSTHPSGLFCIKEMIEKDEEAKDPREINPGISEIHAAIMRKMVAKNPENRFASLKEAYEAFADIGLTCPKCQTRNRITAEYCDKCGNHLTKAREDEFRDKTPEDLRRRAYDLNAVGQFEESIKYSNAAIKKKPDFAEAYLTRGFSHSSLGKYNEALEDFSKTVELTNDNAVKSNAYRSMSFCYERSGLLKEAKAALEDALKTNPNDAKAQWLLIRGVEKGYWTLD
jgi:serine/threonine protein kinase